MSKRRTKNNIFSTPLANRMLEIATRISILEQKAEKLKDSVIHAELLINAHAHISKFSIEIENLFSYKKNG